MRRLAPFWFCICSVAASGLRGHDKPTFLTNTKPSLFVETRKSFERETYTGVYDVENLMRQSDNRVRYWISGRLHVEANDSPTELPSRRKSEYFRPVSTTVYCVMALTVECLLVYTALALSRNADELSGYTNKPSLLTETLTMASRSTKYPPMMCMLFVACRMYVLATTEGRGEPQMWVKQAMIVATIGMTHQFLLNLALPLVTVHRPLRGSAASLAGETRDVHPLLKQQEFRHPWLKISHWMFQVLSMVCIYGGIATVVAGIVLYPRGTTKVSPAVLCTIAFTVLFFSVHLFLWLAQTSAEQWFTEADIPQDVIATKQLTKKHTSQSSDHGEASDDELPVDSDAYSEQPLGGRVGAAIQMCSAVRKAPMFAVLFLASRMRALQLNPPHGMPPPWIQACFILIVIAVALETLVAGFVGAYGRASAGYYQTQIFHASAKLHALQYSLACISFIGLFPVYFSNIWMLDSQGKEAPLSSAVECIFQFAALYFGIETLKTGALILQDVCGQTMTMTVDTLEAAGISVSFCPLLCALFVACRMRALQITQQQGSPQNWAQYCMFVCVFATSLQAVCCLVLPMFTNIPTRVDGDGNPARESIDLRPMIGAYAVTMVKYIALLSLHGAVICICISIFLITPENAAPHGTADIDMESLMNMMTIAAVVILISMLLSSAKIVGLAIKFAVETADETLLGVTITVEAAALSICRGYVYVSGVKIRNPTQNKKGQPLTWQSEYLANIETLCVKLNIGKLIWSLGTVFEVSDIDVEGVHVNFEKKSWGADSNVQHIINHLDAFTGGQIDGSSLDKEAQKEKEERDKKARDKRKAEDMRRATLVQKDELRRNTLRQQSDMATDATESDASTLDIVIHTVNISDIQATALVKGFEGVLALEPIVYNDFMSVLGETSSTQGKAMAGGQIMALTLKVLVGSVMRSVVTTMRKNTTEQVAKRLNKSLCCKRKAEV